jgi:N-acetyl-beta-hexosaminidase
MEKGRALQWNMRNRRQFLLEACIVVAGVAASPLAFAAKQQTRGLQKMRGLMVDAARLPETLAYYRRVIEFCSEWEFNTLHFRLTDDQGSALRFTSVPDLVNHDHAFTPDQLRGLVEYGASHGVDLIPEVESFGHTGFITRSPTYAHLSDSDPVHGEAEFTGIIPVDPQTLPLFEKLYREVATIFSSAYLHGGAMKLIGAAPRSRAPHCKPRGARRSGRNT